MQSAWGTPIFGDALRYLSQAATYLYQDSARYRYATQPTVAKLANDRADDLKRHRDKVLDEIKNRIRDDLKATGNAATSGVSTHSQHPVPTSPMNIRRHSSSWSRNRVVQGTNRAGLGRRPSNL